MRISSADPVLLQDNSHLSDQFALFREVEAENLVSIAPCEACEFTVGAESYLHEKIRLHIQWRHCVRQIRTH